MPIIGLTDSEQRIPRLGKIHLGIKKQTAQGKEYPSATEHFVLPDDHPQYPELVTAFGDEPKELKIVFPVEDETQFASQYYRAYSRTRGLICKGDGITTLMRVIDKTTGDLANRDTKEVTIFHNDKPCAGKECPDYIRKACREVMNLQFTLYEIPGLGVWQIDTSSINSIRNINGCINFIRTCYGRISIIPLLLTLEPLQVNDPDTGKKKTVRVLNLRSAVSMAELAQKALESPLKLASGLVVDGEATVLPESDDEPPDDLPDLPFTDEQAEQVKAEVKPPFIETMEAEQSDKPTKAELEAGIKKSEELAAAAEKKKPTAAEIKAAGEAAEKAAQELFAGGGTSGGSFLMPGETEDISLDVTPITVAEQKLLSDKLKVKEVTGKDLGKYCQEQGWSIKQLQDLVKWQYDQILQAFKTGEA